MTNINANTDLIKKYLIIMSILGYIKCVNKLKKIGERQQAAEMMALDPETSVKKIADKLKVHEQTILSWRRDPNFVDLVYQIYMIEFGAEIPAVLSAMIREAKAGNVQAGRLVLEHSGKLVKNINVTIDSPFEKYLKSDKTEIEYVDAEIQDIVEDINETQDVVLPRRNTENQVTRKREEFKTIKQVAQNSKRRLARNKMHRWKQRAKRVGIEPLPAGRPTKAQKKEWIEVVRAKERELRQKS